MTIKYECQDMFSHEVIATFETYDEADNFTGRPYVARVDTDDDKEADGQTSLNIEEDGTKTPKQRAQDEKKVEA